MAIFGTLSNAYLLVNSVNLSSRIKSVVTTLGKEVVDISCMGNTGRQRALGLEDHTITVTFLEDLAESGAGSVNATLRAIWVGGIAVAINFRFDAGAISTTNPEFQGNWILATFPMGGPWGQYLQTTVTFMNSGSITIDTTP
jgi:hypothetical protein